jgi:nucleoside-diphosphate-sugar epimerase
LKFLITGHEGYIGSALVRFFKAQGHSVFGWGRRDDLLLLDKTHLQKIAPDFVVNCAASMDRAGTGSAHGTLDEKVNVHGVEQIVKALQGSSTGFFHFSTKDVFGPVFKSDDIIEDSTRYRPRRLVSDLQSLKPQTVYAKTKLEGERRARSYAKTNVFRLTSGYTSFYHPRGSWVTRFIESLSEGKKITLHGGGKQLRDLVHADDLGELILAAIRSDRWGQTLTTGGGLENAFSVLEVAELICKNVNADPSLIELETRPSSGDYGFVADNRFAKEYFDWQPRRRFEIEICEMIQNIHSRREAKDE